MTSWLFMYLSTGIFLLLNTMIVATFYGIPCSPYCADALRMRKFMHYLMHTQDQRGVSPTTSSRDGWELKRTACNLYYDDFTRSFWFQLSKITRLETDSRGYSKMWGYNSPIRLLVFMGYTHVSSYTQHSTMICGTVIPSAFIVFTKWVNNDLLGSHIKALFAIVY